MLMEITLCSLAKRKWQGDSKNISTEFPQRDIGYSEDKTGSNGWKLKIVKFGLSKEGKIFLR